MQTQSAHIIELFGGIRPMARSLDAAPSSVQWWLDTGFIPPRHYREIIEKGAAAKPAVTVTPADFVAFLSH